MTKSPEITLRYGTHAEKDYLIKLSPFIGGILYSGNLIEATKAASVSLLLKVRAKDQQSRLYINPMTYIFGPYIDPDTDKKRTDLNWIKSYRKKSKKHEFKDAYQSLSRELGGPFQSAITNTKAVDPIGNPSADRDMIVESTLKYQENRLVDIFTADEEIKALAGDGADKLRPSVLFSPYFYCADEWMADGITVNADLAKRAVAASSDKPVHMIACVSQRILNDQKLTEQFCTEISQTGVNAVWLWFSKFDELKAEVPILKRYRAVVASLAKSMQVHTYAGGFWSMLLAEDGMSGIAHGVGYGERKPVVQVIGAAAPTVRFYLPSIAKRIGVPDIERAFSDLAINTAEDYYQNVCACKICKGVIGNEIKNFSKYGEMHRSDPSKRLVQTATAAKLCRFHFLLHRLQFETKLVEGCNADQRAKLLKDRLGGWINQPTVAKEASHIERWVQAIDGPPLTIAAAFGG